MNLEHNQDIQDKHNFYADSSSVSESTLRPSETRQRDLFRTSRYVKKTFALAEEASFLDFGCGNGSLSRYFLNEKTRYVGVDFSVRSIEVFRHYCDSFNLSNVTLLKELQEIDIEERFDYVLAWASFHLVADLDEAGELLVALISKLKIDGKILIGNIPLTDTNVGISTQVSSADSLIRKLYKFLRFIFIDGSNSISTITWRLKALYFALISKFRNVEQTTQVDVSLSGCLEFNISMIRVLLNGFGNQITYRITPTYSSAPLNFGRCDILIKKI